MSEAVDEAGIATMGERGQVVIPKKVRDSLGLEPKSKFVVYGRGDVIMLRRLTLPDPREELEKAFELFDSTERRVTEAEVAHEVKAERREHAKGD